MIEFTWTHFTFHRSKLKFEGLSHILTFVTSKRRSFNLEFSTLDWDLSVWERTSWTWDWVTMSTQTLFYKHFFPLKSPSHCHYNLDFTHNCLIDCLFVFLSFWSDFSLFIHFGSYSFILIHWNLLSKLNINVASKYIPNRWPSCHRYLLHQLACNITNVYASNRYH